MTPAEIREAAQLANHARHRVQICRGHLRPDRLGRRKRLVPLAHTRGFLEDAEVSLAALIDRLATIQRDLLDDTS